MGPPPQKKEKKIQASAGAIDRGQACRPRFRLSPVMVFQVLLGLGHKGDWVEFMLSAGLRVLPLVDGIGPMKLECLNILSMIFYFYFDH